MSQRKIAMIAAPGASTRALAMAVARDTPIEVNVLSEGTGVDPLSESRTSLPHVIQDQSRDPTGWSRTARRLSKTPRRKLFRA